jgi:hypothetical protein
MSAAVEDQAGAISEGSEGGTMPFSLHCKIGGIFVTGIGTLVVRAVLMLIYR